MRLMPPHKDRHKAYLIARCSFLVIPSSSLRADRLPRTVCKTWLRKPNSCHSYKYIPGEVYWQALSRVRITRLISRYKLFDES